MTGRLRLARRARPIVLALAVLAVPSVVAGGAPAQRGALLDVPYLAQPVRLCGGAALAMVLRYWGEDAVFAEDFSALVDADRGGIPADVLARAVATRGWQSVPAALDGATAIGRVRAEVNRGRPIIALIEAGPNQYHFVVVVGVTGEVVVVHDPARAPFQVVPLVEFDAAWARAERWMLLVLPPTDRPPARAGTAEQPGLDPTASVPCADLVRHSVTAARSGNTRAAERGLHAATAFCPTDAGGWRELAGLRFLERQYTESRRLASVAVARAPDDAHAWQLLATSRYLTGDLAGALEAWNRVGEPRTDVVSVAGASRTPHAVVVDLVDLPPRELLTPATFLRAARRLDELPAASDTVIRYEPVADGWAAVEATVDERRSWPANWMRWGATGVETLLLREAKVDVAGHLGAGENLRLRYRWAANRPRVRVEFDTPAPGPIPGIVSTELSWEEQAYATLTPGTPVVREERVRTGGHLADWPVEWLRWQAGAAIDRLDGTRHVAIDGRLLARILEDRATLTLSLAHWTPTAVGPSFSAGGVAGAWRSSDDRGQPAWFGFAGVAAASAAAPLAVWPGAGTSLTRGALLRAHPLTDGGVVAGDAFGRRLAFATVEHERPVWSGPYGLATMAIFMDTARAWERREPGVSPWHVDLGAGVRFGEPGSNGVVRLDLAYGLRDRQAAVSAGYVAAWGR